MKILLISEWFPYPPINGSKIRVYNLVRQLSQFAEIDLVALVNTLTPDQVEEGKKALETYCRSVQSVPAIPYQPGLTPTWKKLFDPLPDSIRQSRNLAFKQLVADAWKKGRYTLALATEGGALPYIAAYTANHLQLSPLILDGLELGQALPDPKAPLRSRIRQQFTYRKNLAFARRVLHKTMAYTTPSENERQIFKRLAPSKTWGQVAPNVIELADYPLMQTERDARKLIFTGAFSYPANYHAIAWFATQVWPLLTQVGTLSFQVTGTNHGYDLDLLHKACPALEFTGFVPDVRSRIAQSWMSIVPLQSGGGTRLKILEAMALGTPVVSTTIGASGLEVIDGQDILLADSPAEFAHSIQSLLHEPELWQRLSENGRKVVVGKYNASIIGQAYREIFTRLGILV